MIETVVLFGHLVVAGLIIALVLLQRGKGAEAGTGFGSGASGTVFGSRGSANFFSRATGVLAALFFATSLTLAYFSTRVTGPGSLLEGSVLEGAGLESGGEALVPDPDLPPGLGSGAIDDLPSIDLGEVPEAGDGAN